ncbi:MAG: cytochrome c [Pseudomonadota bacterium]
MKTLTSLSVAALLMASGSAFASGDVTRGQELSASCAACHGADGNSTIPANPKLAGQYDSYLVHALKSYRDGLRNNALMNGFAANLSDQDIADLAAYFASQTPSVGVVPRGD